MLSLFTNPFAMIAGVLLISSPIIIHLINRMRFKRVRWAAMEFLLKSQKRAKRKMIIEQLLLLFLRCLLCALFGLLVARFIGCDSGGTEGQNTFHVILIDDTLSTSDPIRGEDGQVREVFEEEKRLVVERIAKAASQAGTPQYVTVVRLSDLEQPRSFGRLNATVIDDIKSYLTPYKPSLMHVDLVNGIKACKKILDGETTMRGVLHVVGDFRAADWGERSKEPLSEAFTQLQSANVEVHLLDCVSPERSPQQKSPLSNDNLAIVDLTPEAKIVAKNKEVEFSVKLRNYSNSEKKAIYLRVRVNGEVREDGSVTIASIPPNGEAIGKFFLTFRRGAEDESEEAGTPDRYNLVSATIEGQPGGLVADDTRFTVVEVRDRVPILIVDNNIKDRGKKEAESFFLQKLFNDTPSLRGYDVQIKAIGELEGLNLAPYSAIFLCDVPRFTPTVIKGLEEYVKAGGGVAFFMGPSIKSDVIVQYNELLYRKNEGLFPVPLDKAIGVDVPDEQRRMERIKRSLTFNKKLLVRKTAQSHPALEKLYKDNRGQTVSEDEYEKFFNFVVIDRYIAPNRQQLKTDLGGTDVLVYLQNTNPMSAYEGRIIKASDELPVDPGKWDKYIDRMRKYKAEIRQIASSTSDLWVVAQSISNMLDDSGDESKKQPGLKEFWGLSENNLLREQFEKLRDEVKFGDPLYVAKTMGQGRVVAFLTSAGASWNDLEGFGRAYYPPMMINMLGYLASAGTDENPVLGAAHEFNVDKTAYDAKVRSWHYAADEKKNTAAFKPLGDAVMPTDEKSGMYRLNFVDGKEPGVYAFKFLERRGDSSPKPDYRALAYNVDAIAEGNLARANTDDVTGIAQKAPLHTANDDTYAESLVKKRKDLSENPWLYLVMMLTLVAEQFMAVRLSYNSAGVKD
jgi:Aerotolerance regulator N-terminal